MKTIIIQGAIPEEIQPFLDFFEKQNGSPLEKKVIHGFDFYETHYLGKKIVISLTKVGIVNATESTIIGIYEFKPDVIINQGTCGAHVKSLEVGTLIVGETAVYMNKYRTPAKKEGEGSNSLEWEFVLKSGYKTDATASLVEILKNQLGNSALFGILGSGDMFTKEIDRINHLHNNFGEYSEDMESSAVYKTCEDFNIDHIGIRIVSNNEMREGMGFLRENLPKIAPIIFKAVMDLVEEI